MAGTITHEWNGTTLIITSDSGTSACDLKGDKGDMGVRGAQAPHFDTISLYPIGSLYLSTNSASPASFIGGTWERVKDRFLLAAGDSYSAGSTGGAKTHTHAVDGIWADMYLQSDSSSQRDKGFLVMKSKDHSGTWTSMSFAIQDNGTLTRASYGEHELDVQYGTSISGTLGSASSLPPYLTVYVWKRVA